ncbi:DCC1-like thiol-disulfide oxidoreductase family protein [Halomonas sp. CS7]|uniref:DCC1-like thiol-disulfide oxidoreductase family protein n=1 Tax=Halomonas pelophila TaxID=3151122 RepID=A0ABV1N134_9GAMM
MSDRSMLKVYYDADCPICRRDRARYERWAGEASASVAWIDVNRHDERLRRRGVEPKAALLSLHVEDAQGRIVDGIDAYILLMRRVPRLRPLAWLIGLPVVRPLLARAYRRWVRRRLARQGRLP